ncbi:MAG TPA: hypothetical protein VE710_18220 [Candidatus Bathyarchaeia archaeon]|nr:hypothetical protein [Candidatus Bathyarchaeia archaeon]
MSKTDRLDKLNAAIKELDHNNPADISELIILYNKVLFIIGDLWADAVQNYGEAYAERKRLGGEIKASQSGTTVEKEAAEDKGTYIARIEEAKAEALVTKYKARYTATQEMIQSLKVRLKMLTGQGG